MHTMRAAPTHLFTVSKKMTLHQKTGWACLLLKMYVCFSYQFDGYIEVVLLICQGNTLKAIPNGFLGHSEEIMTFSHSFTLGICEQTFPYQIIGYYRKIKTVRPQQFKHNDSEFFDKCVFLHKYV